MEAVPRLHMLWFALKSSPEGTSFVNLKKYIAECYQEDPESYSKDVLALETLRNTSMRPAKDMKGCMSLKRYYCQLHSLINRFPQITERPVFTFTWKDLYAPTVHEITELRFEMAATLFNISASHTQVGASVSRGDVDGMKLACTHFQCAAWGFGELREKYKGVNNNVDFMTPELILFMQQVCFAQAQECILEKSLIDNRKPNIVAKVTAQIVSYYGASLAALLTGGDDGPIAQVIESSVYKLWKKYVKFKISYLTCILYLYQGQHAEEQQKMGERVTLYQAAWDKLEEARKESKGLPDQKEIVESLTFTADVVEGKRKNAKNENEFIYHEAVPELSDITAVQGANLVNGIGFGVTDPDVLGEDIFARLVPMKAHEASSMYSEEKAKILRDIGAKIEKNDLELASYMSSLTLDNLNISEEKANKIPQGIVDRCASLNANKAAIPDLITSMSHLAEICAEVETNLNEIKAILTEEEAREKLFQQNSGIHRSNAHFTELTREFQKYSEAHQKAGESNDTLRKAMELHVNNLKILSKPLQEIQSSVPKLSGEFNSAEVFKDLKLILNKVNEMKAQRAQFHADLRIAVNNDDITTKVIAHGSNEGLQALFDKELRKHDKQIDLIGANLTAQGNILAALTESYAKAAPILKTLADVKHKKDNFFSSLAASFDVYEDLLGKSAKGLEFYKKLSGNVQKLLARVRAAKDVQDEDRQQRMKSTATTVAPVAAPPSTTTTKTSSTPKLKDYLKGKAGGADASTYIPSVRPNPLGSENPTAATCGTAPPAASQAYSQAVGPNEPPPPYSVNQYYDPSGYTNPIYHNTPAPPYETQAAYYGNQTTAGYGNPVPATASYEQPLAAQMENKYMQPEYGYGYQQQAGAGGARPQTYTQSPGYSNTQSATSQSYMSSYANTYSHQTIVSPSVASQVQQPAPTMSTLPQNPLMYMPYSQQQAQAQMPQAPQQQPQMSQQQPQLSQLPQQQPQMPQQQPQMQQQQPQQSQAPPLPTTGPIPQNSTPYQYQPTVDAVPQAPYTYQTPASSTYAAQYNADTFQQYTQPPSMAMPDQTQATYPVMSAQPAPVAMPDQGAYPVPIQDQDGYPGVAQPTPAPMQDPTQSPYAGMAAQPASDPNQVSSSSNNRSYSTHPGYSFNPQSGTYEYGSGYQAIPATGFYGQYTSALGPVGQMNSVTTDSGNTSKISIHDQDLTVISHTKPQQELQPPLSPAPPAATADQSNVSYYTLPYGYQSNGTASATAVGYPVIDLNHSTPMYTPRQTTIYMQSGQANSTQTTASEEYAPSAGQAGTPPPAVTDPQPAAAPVAKPSPQPQPRPSKKPTSNIDLLTDIDFSIGAAPMLPAPALQPQIATTTAKPDNIPTPEPVSPVKQPPTVAPVPSSPIASSESPLGRKMSFDNLSIGSDLSSLDHNFDWDNVSVRSDGGTATKSPPMGGGSNFPMKSTKDPFSDAKTLKYFHKEVERFEKTIETLNVQMLNGSTPLKSKWRELHDLLNKDASKRTTSIAKLFPEKNRSNDCIPYDHARVVLETSTDDYINAAYVKDLGPGCPNFIIAQTPQQNTLNDFWSMIWSQKARTVVCLHTPNELLDPFWPQEVNSEMHFDDFSVRTVKLNNLSHCTELNLKLSMNGADAILDLSLLQIKAWTKSSPTQILGIAQNVLMGHKQRCLEFKTNSPLIMNCLTGSERSEQIAVAICAILATQTKRPLLINVVDVWYRICSQRQNALKDPANLELSMQIILGHAHDVLNKRGIMTSYQMKTAQTATAKDKEEVKDPLNELDPLWKLKQK